MIIYKNTFENIKTMNCDFPLEDQFYAENNEAIVADGITRDPVGVLDLATCSFQEMLKKYPRPSGAELAAKEIVESFQKSTGTLKERLIECNKMVKKLNDHFITKCDYLQNDYYGAVASCADIKDNTLYYAYICDCGVVVLDKDENIKFQTKDDKLVYSDPYINKIGIPWNLPESRVIVRRDYRNNLENIQDGKCVSYGALTGEESAISFIKTGTVNLEKDDIVAVYSDGFSHFFQEKDFIDQLLNFQKRQFESYIDSKSNENYSKFGKEKTIVLISNEKGI